MVQQHGPVASAAGTRCLTIDAQVLHHVLIDSLQSQVVVAGMGVTRMRRHLPPILVSGRICHIIARRVACGALSLVNLLF